MAIKELFYDQRPVALLNPRASQRIDPRFKYTRNSTATYVDRDGILQPNGASAGEPRFSYDFDTKEYRGLLLEPGATNIATRGDDPAQYGQNGGIKTANNIAAPDGTLRATKFEYDSAANLSVFYLDFTSTVPATNAGTYTYSVYLKAPDDQPDGYYGGRLAMLTNTGGNIEQPIALTREWKRYSVTKTYTTETGFIRIHPIIFRARPGTVFDGRVIPSYVWIWATQIEQGLTPTSYIPTSVGQASRAADLLSIEASAPATGSVYIDARAIATNVDSTLLSLKNASNQKINLAVEERTELYNSPALVYSIQGTIKPTLPFPVPTTARERNIITWGANNYQYTTGSARFAQSLSGSVPANLTQLSIGSDSVDPTKAFNGYINAAYLYSGEITPAVAEALVRGELDPINADTFVPSGPAGSLSIVVNTQGAGSDGDRVFELPAESVANNNDIVITWGDSTESGLENAAAELGAPGLTKTYSSAGIYPIFVEGQLENLKFNNIASAPDLVQIVRWGTTANGNDVFLSPSTMNSAFYGCSQLDFSSTAKTTSLPDTSAVTDWFRAFRGCSSITGTFPAFNFSAATTFQEAWYGCSSLTSFTAAGDQTQNVTNFNSTWFGCSGLTSFPLINTSSATTFASTWTNCSALTSFPLLNTASCTTMFSAWQGCSALTSFPLLNTASCTNFTSTWLNCSALTAFPLINTSAATTLQNAWFNCSSLTSFPLINTINATNLDSTWRLCSGLTSFPLLDTSSVTNFNATWSFCSALTAFPAIDTSAGTNFETTWFSCVSLTSFPSINTSLGTNFSRAWQSNGFSSFPALNFDSALGLAADSSGIYTGFRDTWRACASLATFPANRFDSTTCTRFLDAWTGCALTAQSIENILVSINTANTSNGNLGIGGGTNAAQSTWTSAATTAYNALVGRGWTITFNP